jgi:hypothetical protein
MVSVLGCCSWEQDVRIWKVLCATLRDGTRYSRVFVAIQIECMISVLVV